MRISSGQDTYVNEVFGLHDPELLEVKKAHAEIGVDFMSVSGAEARLLQFLIRLHGVRAIVEVGRCF
jgi:predicted O-methyltransferase YrrM